MDVEQRLGVVWDHDCWSANLILKLLFLSGWNIKQIVFTISYDVKEWGHSYIISCNNTTPINYAFFSSHHESRTSCPGTSKSSAPQMYVVVLAAANSACLEWIQRVWSEYFSEINCKKWPKCLFQNKIFSQNFQQNFKYKSFRENISTTLCHLIN